MDNNDKVFTPLDMMFANFICELANNKELFTPIAMLSKHVSEGHSCTDVDEIKEWLPALKSSEVVGTATDYKPLILENNRLYLQKYWQYETLLAEAIKEMLNQKAVQSITKEQKELLEILFDDEAQKTSVENSIKNKISIISGGPGTGKTTTIAKLLYILLSKDLDLSIAVCAPTGKASARISESITNSIEQIKHGFVGKEGKIDDKVIEKIVVLKGQTIHRMIVERMFVNPLDLNYRVEQNTGFDILVVDEASMIDLTIMSKLILWAKNCSKIIILGDKNQLFSVDSGSVMNELCNCDKLKNNATVLTKSWRFKDEEGIGRLSKSINDGVPFETILALFKNEDTTKEQYVLYSDHRTVKQLHDTIKEDVIKAYGKIATASSPEEALAYYESLRILCAVKQGPFGVYEINKMVEHILKKEGLIDPAFNEWYDGRPIMIQKNDSGYGLFNGDSGIIYKGKAYFKLASHEKIKDFIPTLLPEHETSYAVTIHKSQGSEFDKVFIILPEEDSRVLCRQLIYTAVTRAKKCAHIIAPTEVFKLACTRSVTRKSGLADKINS